MKSILCYGDSNVWGCIPGSLNTQTGLWARYIKAKRWPGILQQELGRQYEVVEAGLNGRTTNLDEIVPGSSYKNGLMLLPIFLETHYPIDLVIFMLGTNDTKIQYNRSAQEIAEGIRQLIRIVKASNKGPTATPPQILVLAAPPNIKVTNLSSQRDDISINKTQQLAGFYKIIAETEGCNFLDTSLLVTVSKIDGVHLDETAHELLGRAITEKVKQILPIQSISQTIY